VKPRVADRDLTAPGLADCEKYPAGKLLGLGFPV